MVLFVLVKPPVSCDARLYMDIDTLDPGFGTGGVVFTPFGGNDDSGICVVQCGTEAKTHRGAGAGTGSAEVASSCYSAISSSHPWDCQIPPANSDAKRP